jgi:hypothetical protein
MKKEIPLLFSTPMVQAILEGRKIMTRRIVKPQPAISDDTVYKRHNQDIWDSAEWGEEWKCPYGKVGDLIWVRESCRTIGGHAAKPDYSVMSPNDFVYKADESWNGPFKPSIHMPKAAARIWLQVTDVRVERLQEISEHDAKAEGIEQIKVCNLSDPNDKIRYRDYHYSDAMHPKARLWYTAKRSFETLWQSINGEECWNQNPWVWCVSFKVLSTTGRPVEALPHSPFTVEDQTTI